MHAAPENSVLDRVLHAIEQATPVESKRITLDTLLSRDLTILGLRRLKLALYLEEAFDIEIADEAVDRFVTVADIVNYMHKHDFEDTAPDPCQWPPCYP